MLQRIKTYIEENALCAHTDKILIGVSGGVDSMVLLHCMKSLGYSVALANCNFNLRAQESLDDTSFVVSYAQTHNIPYFTTSFNTTEFANSEGISIEMAARNLRYEWFNTLVEEHKFTHIAIAHNANDSIETFFINTLRGTGIKGLRGIPVKNNIIIRPLLCMQRKQIEQYAEENAIAFRTDSTNAETEYVRNKVRHLVIPELRAINENAEFAVLDTIDYVNKAYDLYTYLLKKEIKDIIVSDSTSHSISIETIKKHPYALQLLFEILQAYNCNKTIVNQIYQSLDSQSGTTFNTPTHTIEIHNNRLLIFKNKACEDIAITISNIPAQIQIPDGTLNIEVIAKPENLTTDSNTVYLSIHKFETPATLRRWRQGDTFTPFGMKGSKKISDYLIDSKIPSFKKQDILVLENKNGIAWIVGERSSQTFAVSKTDTECVKVQVTI